MPRGLGFEERIRMAMLTPAPQANRMVFKAAGSLFVMLLAVSLALIVGLKGETYSRPSGLRMPAGPVEAAFKQHMAREGHELAFYDGGRISVLVSEQAWSMLGKAGRYERLRFLSNCRAELAQLQREQGDTVSYTLSIKSEETQRLLAEETDFNPKIDD